MEPQGGPRGTPVHLSKDGPSKPSILQKNAYARLVQKHHSGRFHSYLNYIAQMLQLEEGTPNDSGLDAEPLLKRGLVRETLLKNGVKAPGGSPVRMMQPGHLEVGQSERPNDGREEDFARKQLRHQRDPSAGKGGSSEDVVVEEEGHLSPNRIGDPPALFRVRHVLGNQGMMLTRPTVFRQSTSTSGERDREEVWGDKGGGSDSPAVLDRAEGCASAGQIGVDSPTTNAGKAGLLLPSQTHGVDKRGLARTRNNSESARAPPNVGRRRQLSESQMDAVSNSDCRMNLRQLGTPKGSPHTASSASGERKNRKKSTRGRKKTFEAYMSKEDVSAGLKRKTLIQGPLRINPKRYHEAFIPSPDGTRDIFIDGVVARNRALNGDIVVVKLLPKDQWKVIKPEGCDSEVEAAQGPDAPGDSVVTCDLPDPGKGDASSPDVVIEAQFDDGEVESEKEIAREAQDSKHPSQGAGEKGRDPETCSTCHVKQEDSSKMNDPEHFLQKTAKVVYILEKKHSRAATGFIRLLTDRNSELFKKCAMFSPVDHRVPRAYVALADCPPDFATRPEDYVNTLFICRIVDWREDSNFAHGEECIFTIDPSTAKDLDDALSCKLLPDATLVSGAQVAELGGVWLF
ncbi:DIS3-like exonuclease 2 [Sceloporus undulatus]|uniref:DIS3-like exonuclease 2 n=1 Tax=Sceloporus undulatus TaxID=8520 RepID=UPI001C4C0C09|nr:DIS3-like exonuclease 2 [Sceloporus undulatus]